jgi:hypothetical protein
MKSDRAEWIAMMLHRIIMDGAVCVVLALFMGTWLFIVTRHRSIWLRYTAAEAAFWNRVGFPPARWTAVCRRFEESRAFNRCLWVLTTLSVLLVIYFAGVYVWFTRTFRSP